MPTYNNPFKDPAVKKWLQHNVLSSIAARVSTYHLDKEYLRSIDGCPLLTLEERQQWKGNRLWELMASHPVASVVYTPEPVYDAA